MNLKESDPNSSWTNFRSCTATFLPLPRLCERSVRLPRGSLATLNVMSSSRDGIQVVVRLRPLNERESNNTAARRCLEVVDQASLQYTGRDAPANNHFGFDRVYGELCTQEEAFEVRQGSAERVAACTEHCWYATDSVAAACCLLSLRRD